MVSNIVSVNFSLIPTCAASFSIAICSAAEILPSLNTYTIAATIIMMINAVFKNSISSYRNGGFVNGMQSVDYLRKQNLYFSSILFIWCKITSFVFFISFQVVKIRARSRISKRGPKSAWKWSSYWFSCCSVVCVLCL